MRRREKSSCENENPRSELRPRFPCAYPVGIVKTALFSRRPPGTFGSLIHTEVSAAVYVMLGRTCANRFVLLLEVLLLQVAVAVVVVGVVVPLVQVLTASTSKGSPLRAAATTSTYQFRSR